MKKQNISQEKERRTEELRRERAKKRLFETVRAIRQDNKGVDPDEVLRDVTEAVEAVRQTKGGR